jgi:beta-lactamase regulating signal transducer with metallopeptidase domain
LLPRSTGTPENLAAYPSNLKSIPALNWSWQLPTELRPKLEWLARSIEWLYLSVLLAFLLQWYRQSGRLRDLLLNVRQPSGELHSLFQRLRSDFEVPSCTLEIADSLGSPATACWPRPRVLLPAQLIPRLESDQLADVLRHELAHVQSRDYLWSRVTALSCRILFFHPAIWLAYRKLRQEMEFACDEAVAGDKRERRLAYADCLLKVARSQTFMRRSRAGAIDISASGSLLATRVNALVSAPASRPRPTKIAVGVLSILALSIVPSLGISLHWSTQRVPFTQHASHHISRSETRGVISRKRTNRTVRTRTMDVHLAAVPPAVNSNWQQLAFITTGLGEPTLPTLATQSDNGPEPNVEPIGNAESRASNPGSDPVWDEPPMAGVHKSEVPLWRRVAAGIAGIAGAVINRGEDDSDKLHSHQLSTKEDH